MEAIFGAVHLRHERTGIIGGSCKNADSDLAGLGRGLRFSQVMLLLRVIEDQLHNS